jgi:rhodanese-related sulfurtransferase
MKQFFSHLNMNRRLAILALVLGLIALVAGNPYRGDSVTLDTRELAWIVEKQVDHVSATELADWIIGGKTDFRLLDLRTENEYSDYHIPGAELVPLSGLADYPLLRNEKIILYSEGGIHSAQAWMLLKAKGYKGVTMLMGGLEEWTDRILFPSISGNATPEQKLEFGKMKHVSAFFGGTPQAASDSGVTVERKAMPKLEMPAQTPAKEQPKKKKKEGC